MCKNDSELIVLDYDFVIRQKVISTNLNPCLKIENARGPSRDMPTSDDTPVIQTCQNLEQTPKCKMNHAKLSFYSEFSHANRKSSSSKKQNRSCKMKGSIRSTSNKREVRGERSRYSHSYLIRLNEEYNCKS